jgi:hypothetical protein
MLLLTADVLLLLFITIPLGLLVLTGISRLFRVPLSTDPLGLFLLGLIASTIYFNLLSFRWPVNYRTLVPLFLVACLVVFRQGPAATRLRASGMGLLTLIRAHPILASLSVLLLSLYWLDPSTVLDSRGYHIMTVRWFEDFPAIPGLGNLHGRMAIDPASFILHAAYSFTSLTGNSLYPLNGTLTALFLGWILVRLLRNTRTPAGWVYLLLLVLFYRPLLSYMSSPNSDVLPIICTAYPLLSIFELLTAKQKPELSSILIPLIICLYAPIAKLPAILVAIPCLAIFFLLPRNQKGLSTLLPLAALGVLIYLPWLGRNYLLSGYLVYPLRGTGWLHPDWQIPSEMLQIDYLFGKYSSRTSTNNYDDFLWLEKASILQWFPRMILIKIRYRLFYDLATLLAGIIAPLFWLAPGIRRPLRAAFLFWLAVYLAFLTWVMLSMDYRYGMVFMFLSFCLPLLHITSAKATFAALSLCFALVSIYYFLDDWQVRKNYYQLRRAPFSWREGWIYPLKDAGFFLSGKNYLYYDDSAGHKIYYIEAAKGHLDAPVPLQLINYGWKNEKVEMRGEQITSGFRATEVYPRPPK